MNGFVGLMPAAGFGTRLSLADSCKEMVLVPDRRPGADRRSQRPVCDYLVDQFVTAGLTRALLLRRAAKTDLAGHLLSPGCSGLSFEDIVLEPTPGTAHTLLEGCRRAEGSIIAFGFPDMLLTPPSMLRDTLAALRRTDADAAVALILPSDPPNWDMVDLDGDRLTGLHVRPGVAAAGGRWQWGWCMAAWRPSFTAFLESWLATDPPGYAASGEVAVGHVLAAAVSQGLNVVGAPVASAAAHDIGTPASLAASRR